MAAQGGQIMEKAWQSTRAADHVWANRKGTQMCWMIFVLLFVSYCQCNYSDTRFVDICLAFQKAIIENKEQRRGLFGVYATCLE